MKTLALGTFAFSALLALGTAARADEPNRLITILTAPEPQKQLMAMVLTMNAMAAGAEARRRKCCCAGWRRTSR